MNVSFTWLSAVVLACSLGNIGLGAEADYATLRNEAVGRLDGLKALTAQAGERGIDTARERVTIITAEQFLRFADWDSRHSKELRKALEAWWPMKDRGDELGRELPGIELREVTLIVDAAIRELKAVLERPASRRTAPTVDHSSLEIIDGYFHFDGRPTFPSTFVWMPRDASLIEAYGDINDAYISPGHKRSRDRRTVVSYQPDGTYESMGRVFFGHGRMPEWARQAYPGIENGRRHFTAYDIDHPGTRKVWQALLRDTVPQFAGRKVSQAGVPACE